MPFSNAVALQTRLIQRNLTLCKMPKTPILLLLESMGSPNLECQRQLVHLLASDSTAIEKLEKHDPSTRSVEQYQGALLGCIKALQRFHCRDERLYRLLANHTNGLLTRLETDKLTPPQKWLYGELIREALHLLPEESLLAFPRLASQRTWPNELPEKPGREQILKKVDKLISLRKYDACCQMILHLAQADYQALVTAISRFLKVGALNQATQLARLLRSRYELNPDCVESDFRNWEEGKAIARSIQGIEPLPDFTYLVCKLCAGQCTQKEVSRHLDPFDIQKALKTCAAFPPAVASIIDHLLHQQPPNRAELKRVAEYLTNLRSVWHDEEVRNSVARLIEYFADDPFEGEEEADHSLARRLLPIATSISSTTQVLDKALDALPKEPERAIRDDPRIYEMLVSSLDLRITSGFPIGQAVRTWNHIYTYLNHVSSSTAATPPSILHACLKLGSSGQLPADWWQRVCACALALLQKVNAEALSKLESHRVVTRVQQLILRYARTTSQQPFTRYLPMLFEITIKGGQLEHLGCKYQDWAQPIAKVMAQHKSPWRLQTLLRTLQGIPENLVPDLLPDLIIGSLREESRRIIFYKPVLSSIPPSSFKRIYERIADNFTKGPSFIWAAFLWLYHGHLNLEDGDALVDCQFHWISRLTASNSTTMQAISVGAYKVVSRLFASENSTTKLENLASKHGISHHSMKELEALIQSDSSLSNLADTAFLCLLALELKGTHNRASNDPRSLRQLEKELELVQARCSTMRHLVSQDDVTLDLWLESIDWIIAGTMVQNHNDPDILNKLKRAMPLIEAESLNVEPCNRVLLGYPLFESVVNAPPLKDEQRQILLKKLSQPKLDHRLFGNYPDLKLKLLSRVFNSSSRDKSEAIHLILTKEFFKLLASGKAAVPSTIRAESLRSWCTWGLQMGKLESTKKYIDIEFKKHTLTEIEYEELHLSLDNASHPKEECRIH